MGRGLKIFLIIVGILVLLILFIGVYFYYFYVFKVLRVCVTDEKEDLFVKCDSNDYCLDYVKGNLTLKEYNEEELTNLPEFIREKIKEGGVAERLNETLELIDDIPEILKDDVERVTNRILYCDNTCKFNNFYATPPLGDKEIERCDEGDSEILIELRGKELLALLGWAKEKGVGLSVLEI